MRGAPADAARAWKAFTSRHPAPLFYQASGIAAGGRGNVFIADSGSHRVEKFSADGRMLGSWGTDGAGPLHFGGPTAVAVDPTGDVYLADNGIVKLSSAGRILRRWTGGALPDARSLAIDGSGSVYALSLHPVRLAGSSDLLTITRLSPRGKVLSRSDFPYPGAANGLLSAAIALAPNGDPIVSIAGSRYCHSCDGTYYQVWTLSPAGRKLVVWDAPTGGAGLAVGPVGTIYLTAAGRIDSFSPHGKKLETWGSPGCGPLEFGDNLRLTAGPRGTLYLADSQIAAIRPDGVHLPFRAGVLHVISSEGGAPALLGSCPAERGTVFDQASGLAAGPGGSLYLADIGLGRIQRFDPSGIAGDTFPANYPPFVATDSRGHLYLEDVQRGILEQRSPRGSLLGQYSPADFQAIAVDPHGVIFALSTSGQISILPPIGRPPPSRVRRWWLHGYLPHQGGINPAGIARDGQGNIYVTDTRHSHIQKFSPTGRLLAIWGRSQGSAPGQFAYPNGLTVDGRGHLYVLDAGNNRVQELDFHGRVIAVWGRWGQAPGQFIRPDGIAADAHGNIYVADNGNDRIQELVSRG